MVVRWPEAAGFQPKIGLKVELWCLSCNGFISPSLFPDDGFRQAVHKFVESERVDKWVEAEFSRDCGFNKHHYHMYHVWRLDPVNIKDFFETIQDCQDQIWLCWIDWCLMMKILAGKWRLSPSLLDLQGICCLCAESMHRIVQNAAQSYNGASSELYQYKISNPRCKWSLMSSHFHSHLL